MNPLVLLLLLIGSILAVRWYFRTGGRWLGPTARSPLLWFVLGVLVFLAITGRLGIIMPIVLALLAALLRLLPVLIQFLPLFHRLWRQRGQGRPSGTPGERDRSTAEAKWVRMNLDHATGEIRGSVLCGRFAGRDLHGLALPELVELYRECRRDDPDSAALLEAYLDRVHGSQWRVGSRSERSVRPAQMSSEQAYQVLGLRPGASREAVIQAHRRLMQKLHPDRGGSDYLAAEINRAKEVLLGH